MPIIPTERIRQMRDQRASDRNRLKFAPAKVQSSNEEMIAILNEVLEYRDAEEQSTLELFADFSLAKTTTVPVLGEVH